MHGWITCLDSRWKKHLGARGGECWTGTWPMVTFGPSLASMATSFTCGTVGPRCTHTRRPSPDPVPCPGYQDADELYHYSWKGTGRMNFTDRDARTKKKWQGVLSVEKKAHNEK